MAKSYDKLKTYMDKAMAIKTAMTLFEWDNETLAPKEAGELTSHVIGVLSGEYFQACAVKCGDVIDNIAVLHFVILVKGNGVAGVDGLL